MALSQDRIPVPSEHAPVKDMTTDVFHNRVTVWELENGSAWITADKKDMVEAIDQTEPYYKHEG